MLVVIACSALKKKYRDILATNIQNHKPIHFVFLDIPEQELKDRLKQRSMSENHFMPASLIKSQLEDLEEPQCDESADHRIVTMVSGNLASRTVDEIGNSVMQRLL